MPKFKKKSKGRIVDKILMAKKKSSSKLLEIKGKKIENMRKIESRKPIP